MWKPSQETVPLKKAVPEETAKGFIRPKPWYTYTQADYTMYFVWQTTGNLCLVEKRKDDDIYGKINKELWGASAPVGKKKQYAAQKRELKKRQKDVETKKRTHRLCQIGGAVESVIGSAIEEEDIPKLVGFLKRQEANGKFFSKAMQKEPVANTEEV